jgi:ureidoglycolate hydrolase
VLVREANAHPDGGQVFFPKSKEAFVALLAPPGDEVHVEDFKAFYFDGSCGLQIFPDVWHQPLYPVCDEASFLGKQGAVHACKLFDSVVEFGKWMRVPLLPSLALSS